MEVSLFGQVITLSIIALALSMDAFSLGLGLGIRNPSQRRIIVISIFIGFFHFIMPFVGILIGQFLSQFFQHVAVIVGGTLLCLLGLQMFWSSIREAEDRLLFNDKTLVGISLFACTVSLDSLSAGLSLGFFTTTPMLAVILCGVSGGLMSWIGLQFGRMMGDWIGKYGEVFGGTILIALGAHFIL